MEGTDARVTSTSNQDNQSDRITPLVLLTGVFLISFSLLALEVSLVRILAAVLTHHFVFIIVSLALLGLGGGGIFVYLFRRQGAGHYGRFNFLSLFPGLFSISIILSVILVARIGYIENTSVNILLDCLLLFIPFFMVGIFFAEVFRLYPALSSRIYGFDLAGAAAGSLGAVLVLNIFGGASSSFFIAFLASVAALIYSINTARTGIKSFILPAISFLLAAGLLVASLAGANIADVTIGNNPSKEIYQYLETYYSEGSISARGEIVETRWNAFGRTDLVNIYDSPEMMAIFTDGTAGTPMYQFSGDIDNHGNPQIENLKTDFLGYLPFVSLPATEKDNALIIGPGGGRDVLLALMGGINRITAVEVNRSTVDIVREYADYNGGIYTDMKNITVIVDEGRNFLKRQSGKYNIILLSLPVTNTARSQEGFALTENYLFTTDSIDEYLEHLTDDGRLIVVAHDPAEMMRLLSISLGTLEEKGIDNRAAMRQIYMLGSEMLPVFVLKQTPFEPAEMQTLYQSLNQTGYDPGLSYIPTVNQKTYAPLTGAVVDLSLGNISLSEIERSLKENQVDTSPVTDNSPFFFKLDTGTPIAVLVVLWASTVLLVVVLLASSRRRRSTGSSRRRRSARQTPMRFMVFFTMIGIGFMLVEISTVQRLILFFGQPVLSLAILLFSLLLGAGIGSLYSNRYPDERIARVIAVTALAITAALLLYAFLMPPILETLLGLPLAVRLLVTVVMLAPLGFLMGFPFPLGLRLLTHRGMESYIPWMWGINGISSVVGSALTVVIAINLGFIQSLLLGASSYLIVFLLFLFQAAPPETEPVSESRQQVD